MIVANSSVIRSSRDNLFVDSECHTDTIKQGRETSSVKGGAAKMSVQVVRASAFCLRFRLLDGSSNSSSAPIVYAFVIAQELSILSQDKFAFRTIPNGSAANMQNC
jgi:hypothetical protein